MPQPSRAAAMVAFLAGAAAGVVGSFLQPWQIGPLVVGLALALASLILLLVVASLAGPRATGAAAAGWVLAVVAMLWPRREGDVVLAAVGTAYAYLLLGLVACAVAVLRARLS